MSNEVENAVRDIQAIGAVPHILATLAAMTGLGFVGIAHVTDTAWTACAVLDQLNFGLNPGDPLDITTTLCEEVRDTRQAVIIDSVRDSSQYCDHHTPRLYGFQSYFSIPVFRTNGDYFGTLCGLDPKPARLSDKVTVSTMHLFAQLISKQLDAESKFVAASDALQGERTTAELREQFIAVLGHDLRTPVGSILAGVEILARKEDDPATRSVLERMRRSARRIATLVDDVVDFARGRMGGGIMLELRHEAALHETFEQVVEELRGLHPEQRIEARIEPGLALACDAARLAQLLSNLLKNALVHGSPAHPVRVDIGVRDGHLRVQVSNRGPALPPAVLERLFQPYWRAAGRSGADGLGLGLYIVSEIARSHGGTVQVDSDEEATSFIFTLPLQQCST
jgi:signal transduction histidine kinase